MPTNDPRKSPLWNSPQLRPFVAEFERRGAVSDPVEQLAIMLEDAVAMLHAVPDRCRFANDPLLGGGLELEDRVDSVEFGTAAVAIGIIEQIIPACRERVPALPVEHQHAALQACGHLLRIAEGLRLGADVWLSEVRTAPMKWRPVRLDWVHGLDVAEVRSVVDSIRLIGGSKRSDLVAEASADPLAMLDQSRRQAAAYIREHPGCGQKEAAAAAGVEPSTFRKYHWPDLKRTGLFVSGPNGRDCFPKA